jgi:hypothetical protein
MDVGYLTCRPTNPSTYLGGVFDPAEPPSKARRNRLLQPFGFEDTYSAGIYTLRSVLETWQLSREKKEVSNEDMLSG